MSATRQLLLCVALVAVVTSCAPVQYAPSEITAATPPFQPDAEKNAVAQMERKEVFTDDWRLHRSGGICGVHDYRMETIVVPGLNGEILMDEEYTEARERFFPNAGIQYPSDLYSTREMGRIYVCPKCINAERAWNING